MSVVSVRWSLLAPVARVFAAVVVNLRSMSSSGRSLRFRSGGNVVSSRREPSLSRRLCLVFVMVLLIEEWC